MNNLIVTNYFDKNIKVSSKIKELLKECNGFFFSVAFITDGGVRLIEEELKELEKKGIKGKILTSTYQTFTQPQALERLLSYDNIELKIITKEKGNHHTKGYYFEFDGKYQALIGSSNLTEAALTKNIEWNVFKIGILNDSFQRELANEFNRLWKMATDVTHLWLESYRDIYESNKKYFREQKFQTYKSIVVPNKMQAEALQRLKIFRQKDKDKALIISATGTGKTYLAAFDVNNFQPLKCLFIVHRETILDDALETFQKVIPNKTMGKYTGTSKEIEAEFLFATVQTLSKKENLTIFKADEFDYIIFDEVHHAGAKTYQIIHNYFKPQFLLGMSATPERNDDFNIYEMFDHNIAVEIRLSEAMQFDLVCDFHYYGVKDIDVIDEEASEEVSIESLTVDERVNHIISKSLEYGYSGTRLKGLIFCSRNEEARILSNKLNLKGLKSLHLSGKNSNEEREEAILRLEQNEINGKELDFIITVDIFNEGVDIPSVNQIILLRQTASAIVFIQQIGRGLRKHFEKDFCVILDFIANYKNNYLISVALSGDKTYKKDNLRQFLFSPNTNLYGASTIYFEEIVKQQLLANIDKTNFRRIAFLKEEYLKLKNKVGTIPSYHDFLSYDTIDLQLIINYSDSYYGFLLQIKEIEAIFNENQTKYIELISKKLSNGKRLLELILIKRILDGKYHDLFEGLNLNKQTKYYLTNFFTDNYFVSHDKGKYLPLLKKTGNKFMLAEELEKALSDSNGEMFKNHLVDLINYSMEVYEREYKDFIEEDSNFALYKKYSYEDVIRLLDWDSQAVPLNVGGYKYDKETNTFPIFINYDKEEDIEDTIKYKDQFIDSEKLLWFTKNKRDLNSPEVKTLKNYEANSCQFYLFVRKNKDDKEGKEFYFLGKIIPDIDSFELDTMPQGESVVKMVLSLVNPIKNDIYQYITKG